MDRESLALRVVCPTCRAAPARTCITIANGQQPRAPHADRIAVAELRAAKPVF